MLSKPSPPWCFSNARILYQPALVPVEAAEKVTPLSKGLTLLSLFGWTLGGVFVVDWTSSPVGPYREVAILSGLVTTSRNPIIRDGIGAWASHIVVDSLEAAEGGRDLFGLPTNLGLIDFFENNADDDNFVSSWLFDVASTVAIATKYATGSAVPGIAEPAEILNRKPKLSTTEAGFVFRADNDVQINGWDSWLPVVDEDNDKVDSLKKKKKDKNVGGISLPSFSGCVEKTKPLLKYPLSFVSVRSARLRRPMSTTILSDMNNDGLRGILGGPYVTPCLQLDGVEVVAGKPVEITK